MNRKKKKLLLSPPRLKRGTRKGPYEWALMVAAERFSQRAITQNLVLQCFNVNIFLQINLQPLRNGIASPTANATCVAAAWSLSTRQSHVNGMPCMQHSLHVRHDLIDTIIVQGYRLQRRTSTRAQAFITP